MNSPLDCCALLPALPAHRAAARPASRAMPATAWPAVAWAAGLEVEELLPVREEEAEPVRRPVVVPDDNDGAVVVPGVRPVVMVTLELGLGVTLTVVSVTMPVPLGVSNCCQRLGERLYLHAGTL